jgi:hypothetical protein
MEVYDGRKSNASNNTSVSYLIDDKSANSGNEDIFELADNKTEKKQSKPINFST